MTKQTRGTGEEPQLSAAASGAAVSKRFAFGLGGVALVASAVLGSSCELIADFDRSKLQTSSGGSGAAGVAGSVPAAGSDVLDGGLDADAESADALDAGDADAGDELDAGDLDAGAEDAGVELSAGAGGSESSAELAPSAGAGSAGTGGASALGLSGGAGEPGLSPFSFEGTPGAVGDSGVPSSSAVFSAAGGAGGRSGRRRSAAQNF
jgi:hypothetical protein